jgi:hypothetical protein
MSLACSAIRAESGVTVWAAADEELIVKNSASMTFAIANAYLCDGFILLTPSVE